MRLSCSRVLKCRFGTLLVVLGTVVLLATGCASSSVQTTARSQWAVPLEDWTAVRVGTNAGHVVTERTKAVRLLGNQGTSLYAAEEGGGIGGMLKRSLTVNGEAVGQAISERFSTVELPSTGVVLVFDDFADSDRIRAVDLDSGTERWTATDYQWSLRRLKTLGNVAAAKVAQRLQAELGPDAQVERAQLFDRYAQGLATEIPALNGILIKTIDGLHLLDPATGQPQWSAAGVTGSGIAAVQYLPDAQELLVATSQTDLVEWSKSGQRLLRIDATSGERIWETAYGGQVAPSAQRVRRSGEAVIVDLEAGGAEAVRYDNGERLLQTASASRTLDRGVNALSSAPTALGGAQTSAAVVHEGTLYAVHTSNLGSMGNPDKGLRAYDLSTGTTTWTSDVVENRFDVRDLQFVDGVLVARVVSSPYGDKQRLVGWSAADGSIAWTRDLGESGTLAVFNDQLYAASDSTLHALAPATGTPQATANLGAPALQDATALFSTGSRIAVLRQKGLSVVSATDLSLQSSTPLKGAVVRSLDGPTHSRVSNRLFVPINTASLNSNVTAIQVVNLANGSSLGIVGGLSFAPAESALGGNLPYGYRPTENGRLLYVIDRDRRLVGYRL